MKITYFHNPRCSKSREGLALLQEKSFDLTVVEYLSVGFEERTLRTIIERLDSEFSELVRTNETEYKERPFDVNDKEAVIGALIATPKLFQRPVALSNIIAAIGRPPSNLVSKLT